MGCWLMLPLTKGTVLSLGWLGVLSHTMIPRPVEQLKRAPWSLLSNSKHYLVWVTHSEVAL